MLCQCVTACSSGAESTKCMSGDPDMSAVGKPLLEPRDSALPAEIRQSTERLKVEE